VQHNLTEAARTFAAGKNVEQQALNYLVSLRKALPYTFGRVRQPDFEILTQKQPDYAIELLLQWARTV
jgi:ABC-type enterochelin transport system substrate-binding protein